MSETQLIQCGNFEIQGERDAYMRSKQQPSLAPSDGLACCQAEKVIAFFLLAILNLN